MRFRNSRWFSGIIIGISGILIGNFLIPFMQYTFSEPWVEIAYPVDAEVVYWLEGGSTVIGNYWKLQDNHVYTLIHPKDTDYWYVQPMPTLVDGDSFRGRVHYGNGPEGDGSFEIQALMTTTELVTGEMYTLQEMEVLRDESSAKSKVPTVTKQSPGTSYTLTVNVNGEGNTEPVPGTYTYAELTQVTIAASPAYGYRFDHWEGDTSVTNTSVTIIMNSDRSITACFEPAERKEYTRECEDPDEYSVGQTAQRTNASGSKVHGQFGCDSSDPWAARAGYVEYDIPELCNGCPIYPVLRYSKSSPSIAPIMIHLDEETQPRAVFTPNNQESWNEFTETEIIDLGQITAGAHTIRFVTDGQQYGVVDLDKFSLYYFSE